MLRSRPTRGAWIEIPSFSHDFQHSRSRPTRGAWIEMPVCVYACFHPRSRPTRGAWIEICRMPKLIRLYDGRAPHGARGLKCLIDTVDNADYWSRPTRGAWIEMPSSKDSGIRLSSRPTRGAWIEINITLPDSTTGLCRAPHGARGLKYFC